MVAISKIWANRTHIARRMNVAEQTLRTMGLMGDPIDVAAEAPAMDRFLGLTARDPNR